MRLRGFTYHIKGDSLICITSGEHPPTPPGFTLVRTVGKYVRGILTCHHIEFKRSRVASHRPPALPASQPEQARDRFLYSQIPEVEYVD